MNPMQQFEMLGRKQLALQEGVELLRQTQLDLLHSNTLRDTWGTVSIFANLTLVPLNCIVSAFELKAANSLYQMLVRELYKKFAASGSRLEGPAKATLSLIKSAITEELKRRAMGDFVPGVNIMVGLAEDSLTLWQTMQSAGAGKREGDAMMAAVQRKITATIQQITLIGIQRADLLQRVQTISRTA